MIHTSPYFTPPKWAQLRSPYFSSYFAPFYPFVCVFSHSCILTPNACWVVDCLKYLEVFRHFIIPREPGDQLTRLRVAWKTTTQRVFSDASLLRFHFIRRRCTLSKRHIDSKIQMWCIWDKYFSKPSVFVNSDLSYPARRWCAREIIYGTTFLLSFTCLNNYLISLTQINSIQNSKAFPIYKIAIGIPFASCY